MGDKYPKQIRVSDAADAKATIAAAALNISKSKFVSECIIRCTLERHAELLGLASDALNGVDLRQQRDL